MKQAALMLHAAAAAHAAGSLEDKMPDFSWDTIPVAYHGASYGSFSNASLQLLAKFPAVTLEKCQGWRTPEFDPVCRDFSCKSCCEENVYAAVGAQIKAINASTKVIAYLHSNKALAWYDVARAVNQTDACYNGDAMNESSCVMCTGKGEYAPYYDFRKPAGRKAYYDACLDMTKTGNVDGCFADGCVKVEAPGMGADKEAFLQLKYQNLADLQQQVPGPLICGSNGVLPPKGIAASQIQKFPGTWGDAVMVNRSASQGVMFQAHGQAICYNPDVNSAAFQQEYAVFLMFAQRWTYYICGGWCGSDPVWPPAFDIPLGEPLGNATATGADPETAVWTRKFAGGTEVFFSRANETGWVKWGAKAQDFIAAHY